MKSLLVALMLLASGAAAGVALGGLAGILVALPFGFHRVGFAVCNAYSGLILGPVIAYSYGKLFFGEPREIHAMRAEYVLRLALLFAGVGGCAAYVAFKLPLVTATHALVYAAVGAVVGWDLGTRVNFPHRPPRPLDEWPSPDGGSQYYLGRAEALARAARVESTEDPHEALVRLWDGRLYRRESVERLCPDLCELADAGVMEEVVPYDVRLLTREVLRNIRNATLAICAVFPPCLALEGKLSAAEILLGTLAIVVAFGAFGTAVFLPAVLLFARLAFPIVISIDDNRLTWKSPMRTMTAELGGCRWYEGKTSHADTLPQFYPKLPALIVVLPDRSAGFIKQRGARVACGLSDETRRRWRAFFILTRVPREQ